MTRLKNRCDGLESIARTTIATIRTSGWTKNDSVAQAGATSLAAVIRRAEPTAAVNE